MFAELLQRRFNVNIDKSWDDWKKVFLALRLHMYPKTNIRSGRHPSVTKNIIRLIHKRDKL
jgi:hypothetical protein